MNNNAPRFARRTAVLFCLCVGILLVSVPSVGSGSEENEEPDRDLFPGMQVPPPVGVRSASAVFPLVDPYGQSIHGDWPGKVHADAELSARQASEISDIESHPTPVRWNRYGGDAADMSSPEEAFPNRFSIQKRDGRWFLVDPSGARFFSLGINGVGAVQPTIVTGRERFFSSLPPEEGGWKAAWRTNPSVLKGDKVPGEVRAVDFDIANKIRLHGPLDWLTSDVRFQIPRLRSWGFNTLGSWTPPAYREGVGTPYVITISYDAPPIEGAPRNWRKFPDPFHPGFLSALEAGFEKRKGNSVDDPFCIGYFVDNELRWGGPTGLADAALASPQDQPARMAFEGWLRNRGEPLDGNPNLESRAAFTRVIMERYFSTIRQFLKEKAPGHLYLGCRFVHDWDGEGPSREVAANYCDLLSFTAYTDTFEQVRLPDLDVPILIAEIGFGVRDRGMYAGSLPWLTPVSTQTERAQKWRAWADSAFADPRVVGVHWFCHADQPLTGRATDGENFPLGFVDVTGGSYPDLVKTQRAIARDLYETTFNPTRR